MVLSFSMLFSFSPASYNNVPKTFPKTFFRNIEKFFKVVCVMFATSALYFCILRALVEKSVSRGAVVGCFFENPDSIKTLKDEKSFSDSKWGSQKKLLWSGIWGLAFLYRAIRDS